MYKTANPASIVSMTEIGVSEARARLAEVIDSARVNHEPIFLVRRGRRVAAVVDADDLAALVEAAEDLADLRATAVARAESAETGAQPVPWSEVKADLGLA